MMKAWLCTADVRAIVNDIFKVINHRAQAAAASMLALQLRTPLSAHKLWNSAHLAASLEYARPP